MEEKKAPSHGSKRLHFFKEIIYASQKIFRKNIEEKKKKKSSEAVLLSIANCPKCKN